MWARFSAAEMARRRALARGLMAEHDLRALVVFGNSGVARGNMANVFWLSNHLDLHHCYLVEPADEGLEPALYTGLTNHVPNARETSDVPIVEWGGYDPAERVADRLQAIGAARGRVGLVGVNATFAMGMPYAHHARLRERLPTVELVDVTRELARLRLVKSDEEVEWLRRASGLTDAAMAAVAEAARPGVSEAELVAAGEAAFRPAGGTPRIMFLRSMPMDAPTGCLPAQNPSGRRLERGDVVITELSASWWGYTGQIQRPVFVDAEPEGDWRRLLDAARAAYDALESAVRDGAGEADAIAAAEPIRAAGFAIYDDLVHGYGVDILPPIVDRRAFAEPPGESRPAFRAGMAVVLQPNPVTPDERMGLQLGGLTIVRADGCERLHGLSLEPVVGGS